MFEVVSSAYERSTRPGHDCPATQAWARADGAFSFIRQPSRLGATVTYLLRDEPTPRPHRPQESGAGPAKGLNFARFPYIDIREGWDQRFPAFFVRSVRLDSLAPAWLHGAMPRRRRLWQSTLTDCRLVSHHAGETTRSTTERKRYSCWAYIDHLRVGSAAARSAARRRGNVISARAECRPSKRSKAGRYCPSSS